MAIKPHARTIYVREQVIHDLPSGLTLRFRCRREGCRLVLSARALPGDREILFDADGNATGVGPSTK